jgi:hypothetical protein
LVALAFTLALLASAEATVIQEKTLEDMLIEADLVAIAQVTAVQAFATTNQQYAYTYVTLGGLDVLQGAYDQPTLTLRTDGGPLGNNQWLRIAGMPQFKLGEKVVVFVKGNTERICPLVGWEQGLLRVVKDPRTGREVLKTSQGRGIHGVKDGDLVTEPDNHAASDEITGGVPDYGPHHELEERGRGMPQAELSVDDLKTEVHAMRVSKGLMSRSTRAVRSAEVKLDSPAPRQPKRLDRGN